MNKLFALRVQQFGICGSELSSAFQRLLAVLETLRDFGDRVHARLAVLILDVGRNLPTLVTKQLQYGRDGRVTLAEGQVRTMILLSILNVQSDDSCVVLRNVRDGVPSRGHKVADVKIDADVG